MNTLQDGAASLGLNTPMQRFLFASAVGVLVMYTVRPPAFFTDEGAPKPMASLASDEQAIRFSSLPVLPWWSPALAAGVIFSTFV
jgi:hypothetical protein